MKVDEWALLQLHKGYSIPATMGVTKKLVQQYVGPFQILGKIGRLAYKLNISVDWKVHTVFLVAQLEPSPSLNLDLFSRPFLSQPLLVFVNGNTNTLKLFEVEKLLNKRLVK